MAGSGRLPGVSISTGSEEEAIFTALYPYKDPFRRMQMMTELQPKSVTMISVLGVIRRRFDSKILKMFEEEYRINQVSRERKGRLEAAEVSVGLRRRGEDEAGNPLR